MLDPEFVTEHWPLRAVSLGETFMTYPTRKVIQIHAAEGVFVELIAAGTTRLQDWDCLSRDRA